MGELEEKETPQTETTAAQETLDEPKETDKMLESKKEKSPSPLSSKPATPNAGKKSPLPAAEEEKKEEAAKSAGGDEIIDIPTENGTKQNGAASADGDEKKISKEEREVKPKKIPIGGLKLPGFFMKNKPKTEGDGAEGELLEKDKEQEEKEASGGADAAAKDGAEPKPRAGLGKRLRNFFVRKPAADKEQQKKQLTNGDADAKSGKSAAGEGEVNHN